MRHGLTFPSQARSEAHGQELSRARGMLLPRWEAAAGWQVCAAVLRAGVAPEARAAAPQNASLPSYGLPLHPRDLVLEHACAECATDAICIQ